MHLNMTGSGREVQTFQSNFTPLPSVAQQAIERISVNQNVWAIGPNLVYHF